MVNDCQYKLPNIPLPALIAMQNIYTTLQKRFYLVPLIIAMATAPAMAQYNQDSLQQAEEPAAATEGGTGERGRRHRLPLLLHLAPPHGQVKRPAGLTIAVAAALQAGQLTRLLVLTEANAAQRVHQQPVRLVLAVIVVYRVL